MASYVVIEFDRTAPAIEIQAPNYTTNEITTVIRIEASESVSSYQEFYVIDNQGTRHDYTFLQEDSNTFIGRIRFNTMPLGLVSLYARVKDEVDNISDVAMATIEVKEHNRLLKMDTRFSARGVSVKEYASNIDTREKAKAIKTDETAMDVIDSERTQSIDSRINERKD